MRELNKIDKCCCDVCANRRRCGSPTSDFPYGGSCNKLQSLDETLVLELRCSTNRYERGLCCKCPSWAPGFAPMTHEKVAERMGITIEEYVLLML